MRLLRRAPRRRGPLRVLFVVPALDVGGAERHVVTLAPALDPDRVLPSVVTIGDEGALFRELVASEVPAAALRSRRNPVAALCKLVRIIRRTRPDVIITWGYNAEALGRLAAVLTRTPRAVVWVHNSGDVAPYGRVRHLVDRVLDRVTDSYYAVANGQRPYLTTELGFPDSKIQVIHNGVDPARFAGIPTRDPTLSAELRLAPGAPVLGIVAVLRPEKDHEMLLRATVSIRDEIPDVQLLVIGDGPLRTRLETRAAELGIASAVVFAGHRADVPRVLGLLDVAVLSSYTVECFPMALLEAMAAGVPVVATAVGGVPEMIDEGVTGHVVPPGDERALADAVIKILRDPQRAAAMGRAARRHVEQRFTLERSVRAAEAAIERTAGRVPGARPVRLTVVMDQTAQGGAELLTLNLFRRFDPARVVPKLVCLRSEGPIGADFAAVAGEIPLVGRRVGRQNLRTVLDLVRWLRADRTDVVLVSHHFRASLSIGRLAARLAGVANVIAAHDMDLTDVGGRVLPRHDVETLFLTDAMILLAPSQGRYLHEREGVGRFPWRRVREVVVRNGIELRPPPSPADRVAARSRLGLADSDVVIGIVARLSAQKAHQVLLRAFAELVACRPQLRLVAVGGGPREEELRRAAAELGVGDRVTFLGMRSDVADLLPGFDVSCLSSVHEGAPLSVCESMAAALPVVCTDVGALRDMVADGEEGFLVPVGDEAALGARLAQLCDDPDLRAVLGARARQRAEREFSIENTVAGYTRLLTELVGG